MNTQPSKLAQILLVVWFGLDVEITLPSNTRGTPVKLKDPSFVSAQIEWEAWLVTHLDNCFGQGFCQIPITVVMLKYVDPSFYTFVLRSSGAVQCTSYIFFLNIFLKLFNILLKKEDIFSRFLQNVASSE